MRSSGSAAAIAAGSTTTVRSNSRPLATLAGTTSTWWSSSSPWSRSSRPCGDAGGREGRRDPVDVGVRRDDADRAGRAPTPRSTARTTSASRPPARRGSDVEPPGVVAHRHGCAEPGRHDGQQARGVLDDDGRHAEAAVEHDEVVVVLAEVAHRLVPGRRRPRRRALGDVAEHGDRPRRAAPPDGAQLHGREVLRLVEHDVAEARARGAAGRRSRRAAPCRRATSGRRPWCGPACPTEHRLLVVGEVVARRRPAARRRRTTAGAAPPAGSSAGHTDETYVLTAADFATASCTRSSGASPARSISSSTWWARRWGSRSRAAE